MPSSYMTAAPPNAMVLLIGNFPPDQQQSMQRFSEMMLRELRALGIPVELVRPEGRFIRLVPAALSFVRKWVGYVDKLILFPRQFPGLRGAQIVHICDHSNAIYAKHFPKIPAVVTCHDLLAVRGSLGEETDCSASWMGKILQRWILAGLRRARAVVCVSQATAADAVRLLGTSENAPDISVIENGLNYDYQPLSQETARARLAIFPKLEFDRPFVLHVGSGLRRKNREGVLRIFARTKDQWNARLVFAGDALSNELWAQALELNIADRIVEMGSIESELLEALYNCAHALLFPSRFEGFGWPIAEAQACGCPVLCRDAAPMSDVAGGAALLRAIEDEDGFSDDLLRLRDPDVREKYRQLSLRNAQRFSARKMAERYLALYRNLGAAV
jgi:glycosyltransferase involved in cell wall biosynthesis